MPKSWACLCACYWRTIVKRFDFPSFGNRIVQYANVYMRPTSPGCPVPDVDLRQPRFGPGVNPAL
jgi:hypothetical protein